MINDKTVDEILKTLLELEIRGNGFSEKFALELPKEFRRVLVKKGNRYFLPDSLRSRYKVVLTGGVFDILHYGHIYTLNRAKKYGDVLVVVIARDETVERLKGKLPVHNQKYRKAMVEQLKPVDVALIGSRNRLATIKRVRPDVIVFGYDQKPFVDAASVERITGKPCRIVRLKKPVNDKIFKSSKIKDRLGV